MARSREVKGTILVVDDNEALQQLVREILESEGYQVHQATRALDGIALAKLLQPALILMDNELPDLNGLLAVKLLKNALVTRDIPVAALTALDTEADREAARQAGCVDYIAKPFRVNTFLETVAALLRQPVPLTQWQPNLFPRGFTRHALSERSGSGQEKA